MVKTITQEIGILPAPIRSKVRYKALWIKAQYADEHGEWNPDRDEYGTSYHSTRKSALTAAITEGKVAEQCEWFMVAEQKYIGYCWIDQRRWTGDWSGIIDLTFTSDEVE